MRHGGNVWEAEDPSGWLDFSANLRPEGCPDWVEEVVREALSNVRYYPDPEQKKAVKGLSVYAGVPESRILPTAGGSAAIDLAISTAEKRVLTLPVTFSEYGERAKVHGLETGVWNGRCDPGDTVVICNPNNPTGEAMSREEMIELYRRIKSFGGRLIVDEAFIDYCPEFSVRNQVCEGLTVVGSLTKILGIPGIRLGYICGEEKLLNSIRRQMLPWSVGTIASAIAENLPAHMGEIRSYAEINRLRREKLRSDLISLGADVQPSQANFLLAVFDHDMTDAVSLLKSQGILVRVCASFGLPANTLRIAVRTDDENAVLFEALRNILRSENV